MWKHKNIYIKFEHLNILRAKKLIDMFEEQKFFSLHKNDLNLDWIAMQPAYVH